MKIDRESLLCIPTATVPITIGVPFTKKGPQDRVRHTKQLTSELNYTINQGGALRGSGGGGGLACDSLADTGGGNLGQRPPHTLQWYVDRAFLALGAGELHVPRAVDERRLQDHALHEVNFRW